MTRRFSVRAALAIFAAALACFASGVCAQAKSTLVWGTSQAPRHLNPAVQSGIATMMPGAQIFASPLRFDDKWNAQPYLAESWSFQDDGLSLLLKLVPNATFRPAGDLGGRRVLDHDHQANHRSRRCSRRWTGWTRPSAGGGDPHGENNAPVGSGYKFVEFRPGDIIWTRPGSSSGTPALRRVIFRIFRIRRAPARSGGGDPLRPVLVGPRLARRWRSRDFDHHKGAGHRAINWLAFSAKPFDDARIRQAVSFAVDSSSPEAACRPHQIATARSRRVPFYTGVGTYSEPRAGGKLLERPVSEGCERHALRGGGGLPSGQQRQQRTCGISRRS